MSSIVQKPVDGGQQNVLEPAGFFKLAPEVRMLIYKEIFSGDTLLITLRPTEQSIESTLLQELRPADFSIRKHLLDFDTTPQRAADLDLLYVCKTIRNEALSVFYGSITFTFSQPGLYDYFSKALPQHHRSFIKHVAVDLGINRMARYPFHPYPFFDPMKPFDRKKLRSKVPDRSFRHFFVDEVFEKEWHELPFPPLDCLEARMWCFVMAESDGHYMDHSCNNIMQTHKAPDTIALKEEMSMLTKQLMSFPTAEKPLILTQIKSELLWRLSIDSPLTLDLPSELHAIQIDGPDHTGSVCRLGVICVKVSFRKPGFERKRECYFENAEVVRAMDYAMCRDRVRYERLRGLESW